MIILKISSDAIQYYLQLKQALVELTLPELKENIGFIYAFLQRLSNLEIVHIFLRKVIFHVNLSEHASN
jgi:hypothetical protein